MIPLRASGLRAIPPRINRAFFSSYRGEMLFVRRKSYISLTLLLFSLFLTSLQVQAQVTKPGNANPPQEGDEIDEGDVISVTTSEVMLPVTVRDANGQLVTTLTRESFRVF